MSQLVESTLDIDITKSMVRNERSRTCDPDKASIDRRDIHCILTKAFLDAWEQRMALSYQQLDIRLHSIPRRPSHKISALQMHSTRRLQAFQEEVSQSKT